jgi:7,8-dihydropterin-6-yl-methyl-4-(beta-D-ribofuranosyl)aminobenzene 5'-phosphate synthase
MKPRLALTVVLLVCLTWSNQIFAQSLHRVSSLRVTILSTMVADFGTLGEWGFSALIEADGHRLLFDTGNDPDLVLGNLRKLNIDISDVTEVFLSHNHFDHTGGLLTLRNALSKENPEALQTIHVAEGIFLERVNPDVASAISMQAKRTAFENTGGSFVIYSKPHELFPGVWITGPVPRVHPERNYPEALNILSTGGPVADTIPESQSIIIDTDEGLVVISGCGHAGMINTMTYARESVRDASIHAVIGGFHLFGADENHLTWTADQMKGLGVTHFIGAHCTGINAAVTLRSQIGLDRKSGVVGAVGASFELGKGIQPGVIAR